MPKNTKAEKKPEHTFSLISNEKLLAIYAAMLKCRLLELRATALFQHGKLNSDLHASSGLEATAAAAAIDLTQQDSLCLAPNDWLPAFIKGLSPETLFRALAPSSAQGTGTPQIEADHKNILLSSKADPQKFILDRGLEALNARNGAVGAAFISSDKDALAQWRATIETAGKRKLPIIFVHYSKADDAPSASRSQKPEALVHGVPSIGVDALDPVAVYRVAYEAIVRARQLRGATLLKCMTDQPLPTNSGVSGVDPAIPDPVAAIETYLKSKGIEFESQSRQTIEAFNRDLDMATRFLDK